MPRLYSVRVALNFSIDVFKAVFDVSVLIVLTKIEFYVIIYNYVFIKSAVLLTACRKLFIKRGEY